MNKAKSIIGFGLLFVACAAAMATIARDPITLKYAPKVGDELKYKLDGQFNVMNTDATISADSDNKVTKVDTDGTYTVVATTSNFTVGFNGQTMSQPDTTATRVSKANGELVSFQMDMDPTGNASRLAEVQNFIYPDHAVSVGDEWHAPVAADDKKGIIAMTRDYKVDSLEKIGTHDTAKIKITYKETSGSDPISRDGFVWIDVKDGTLVKSDSTFANYPGPQGPISGSISMTRVE